jgi:4a-hydroxytetrahydrobiopterin dehydratase
MPSSKELILAGSSLSDVAAGLSGAGWVVSREGKAITKTFQFSNFRQAMAFMLQSAFEAEVTDHHPEWFNVYNRVDVTLTTHDAGGVTERDLVLARAMEKIGAESPD